MTKTAAQDFAHHVEVFASSNFEKVTGVQEVIHAFKEANKLPESEEMLLHFYVVGATRNAGDYEEATDREIARNWPRSAILEFYPHARRMRIEAQRITRLRVAPNYTLLPFPAGWDVSAEGERIYQEKRATKTAERMREYREKYEKKAREFAQWFSENHLSDEPSITWEDIRRILYKAIRNPSVASLLPKDMVDDYLHRHANQRIDPEKAYLALADELAVEWTKREMSRLGYEGKAGYYGHTGVLLIERGETFEELLSRYNLPQPKSLEPAGEWDLLTWDYAEGAELAIGLIGHEETGGFSVVCVWEPREYAYLQYATPQQQGEGVFEYPLPFI